MPKIHSKTYKGRISSSKLQSQATAQFLPTSRKSRKKFRMALVSAFIANQEAWKEDKSMLLLTIISVLEHLRSLVWCLNVLHSRQMWSKEISNHHLIIKVSIRCTRSVGLAARESSMHFLPWSNKATSIAALQSPITHNKPNVVPHLPKIEIASCAQMDH